MNNKFPQKLQIIKGKTSDKLEVGINLNQKKDSFVALFSVFPLKRSGDGKVVIVKKMNPITGKEQEYPSFNYDKEKSIIKQIGEDEALKLKIFFEGFLGLNKLFYEFKEFKEFNGYYNFQILGTKSQINFSYKKGDEKTKLIENKEYNRVIFVKAVKNGKTISEGKTNINFYEVLKIKILLDKLLDLNTEKYINRK